MIDVWSSTGISLPRQMTRRDDIPFPMDEATFLHMSSTNSNSFDFMLSPNRDDSLLAQMIKLNSILLEINDFIKALTSDPTNLSIETTVETLSLKLAVWEAALPPNLCDTPENLHTFASQGLGRIFVAIYLGYYHFGQLLFYQFLDEQQRFPSSLTTQAHAKKCKSFAMSLSQIIDTANSTPGCEVKYNMVGHITVVASSVFIHTLLFETDEHEIAKARSQLEKNFETLVALRGYWPALEACFARLRSFHELCRKSMNTSFRMDRWMLSFLTEFARPIREEEREGSEEVDLDAWSVGNIGFSPGQWV
jgi:hypothetical protein